MPSVTSQQESPSKYPSQVTSQKSKTQFKPQVIIQVTDQESPIEKSRVEGAGLNHLLDYQDSQELHRVLYTLRYILAFNSTKPWLTLGCKVGEVLY